MSLTIVSGPYDAQFSYVPNPTGIGAYGFDHVWISPGGTYNLRAVLGDLYVDLQPITVFSGNHLVVVQQPVDTIAGAADGLSVSTIVNNTSSYTSTFDVSVVICSGPTGAQIGGTTTVTAQDGAASFDNLIFTRAGNYTLATLIPSGSNGFLIAGHTHSFTVAPAAPAKTAFLPFTTTVYDDEPSATPFQVAVQDVYGNLTTDSTSRLTLTISGGPENGTWGPLTATAVNGVVSFGDLPALPAGSYALQVSSDTLAGTTTTLNVVRCPAAFLVIAQQPDIVEAERSFGTSISIRVEDRYHRLVKDFADTITLNISAAFDSLGLFPDATTSGTLTGFVTVQPVGGIANFPSLSVSDPGYYFLRATAGTLGAQLSQIYAMPTPSQLGLSSLPASIAAGQTIALSVSCLNNLDVAVGPTIAPVTFTASIVSGPRDATLNGTTSLTNADGVATFSDLFLTTPGTYVLSVSAPDLGTVSTRRFTITPDFASSHLVVLQQPSPVVGSGRNTLQLAIRDRFGNPITTQSAVALALKPGVFGGSDPIGFDDVFKGAATVTTTAAGLVTFKNLSFNTVGTVTLTASDAALSTASLDVPIVVAPGTTAFRSVHIPGRPVFGRTLTLSAGLRSTAPTVVPFTGTLELLDQNDQVLGTAALTAGGSARFTLTGLAAGDRTCRIRYAGDESHTGVTSAAFPLNIAKAATRLTLQASTTRPVFGQPLALTATLPDALFGSRTGSIQFLDNGNVLATVPVTSTASSYTISTLAVGVHRLTAVYSGDDNFAAATETVSRSIRRFRTVVVLAQPVIHADHSITLAAEFTVPAGTPTGLVTFKAGDRILGTGTLTGNITTSTPINAIASLTTSLTAGTYSLIAVYGGDGSFAPATSLKLITTIAPVV